MNRMMSTFIVLAVLAISLQVVVGIFVKEKNATYLLTTEDNVYKISEKLQVIKNDSYYDFTVTDKDNKVYSFSVNEDFNKQTELIRDIKQYKSNDVSCIFPIYRRSKNFDVSCMYKGNLVSYTYLKQINNKDIDVIIKKLQDEEYSYNSWDRKAAMEKISLYQESKGIEVYQGNISKEYVFLIWRYKGLYILQEGYSFIKDYLNFDIYDNTMSTLVDKYYVTPIKNDKTGRISGLYYYNTRDLFKGVISLPKDSSSKYYFNGVHDKKLYMTDIGNSVQYAITPEKETVEIVGDKEIGFVSIVDNKKTIVSADKFLNTKVYFNDYVKNADIQQKYGNVELRKDGNFYYFKSKDGSLYRAHVDYPTNAELLMKFSNLKDWKVKNGDLLLVVGNTVYFYNNEQGLLPIAYNKELSYNYKNIVDFWKR